MKLACRPAAAVCGAIICVLSATAAGQNDAPRAMQTTAFYYGPSVPRELAAAFDQVVVEPDHVPDPTAIAGEGAAPVAYLSIGEVAGQSRHAGEIDPAWVLARNPAWHSLVMDVRAPGYRAYVRARFEALFRAGYRRFFLDTLDSYVIASRSAPEREASRRALCALIRELSALQPEARLLLNRGFELLPEVAGLVHGVAAESLFDGWDAARQRYVAVKAADRDWLLARLREARARYRLPVIVIDYRPPEQREAARATASKIARLGFVPWVSDGALSTVGVGAVEVLPRRVLILTNGERASDAAEEPPASRWLSPVIEHLGYVPEHRNVRHGLPDVELAGRYQGVVTWFDSNALPAGYGAWLVAQVKAGVRCAIFGAPGFALDGQAAQALGIRVVSDAVASASRGAGIVLRDALIGFEAEPPARPLEGVPIAFAGRGVVPHLQIADAQGRVGTAIATTDFGGVALSHVFAMRGLRGERAWVLDPFAFIERALALPAVPRPDLTTENGRRVALFVIRAHGLSERARLRGRPSTAAVLARHVLARGFPHAIETEPLDEPPASQGDRDALSRLSTATLLAPGELLRGNTDARGEHGSLTRVQALASPMPSGTAAISPIALDLSYLRADAPEAYPYRDVIDTLAFTDAPRRLAPAALHYHAYAAASPGGLSALNAIYDWLESQHVLAITAQEYAARVRAFRDLVMVRDLHGVLAFRGGEALRTVRVPLELGNPDLRASSGVATVRTLPQGRYVTFSDGVPRRLALSAAPLALPHLQQASGRVLRFTRQAGSGHEVRLSLRIAGHRALEFEVAGLAAGVRCTLELEGRHAHAITDANGVASFRIAEHDTGDALLRCAEGSRS